MLVFLPWPDRLLWPNARAHWAPKSRKQKGYRDDCCVLTKAQNAHHFDWGQDPLPVEITFHPPDKRKRDRDNMIAAFKHGQDGVSLAMGIDDALFVPTYSVGEIVKGGAVSFSASTPSLARLPVKGVIS